MRFMVNVNPGGAIIVKDYDFFVSEEGDASFADIGPEESLK